MKLLLLTLGYFIGLTVMSDAFAQNTNQIQSNTVSQKSDSDNTLNNQTNSTLSDVSVMTFTIDSSESLGKITVKNWMTNEEKEFIAPDGEKYYVVSLLGELKDLRKKYRFIAYNHQQFVAIFENAKGKLYSKAFMIKGLFGWQSDNRNWLIPSDKNGDRNNDKLKFTVAFKLPSALTNFQIGLSKLDGSNIILANGEVNLIKK